MKVTILRLGHRFERDRRMSTHIGLVSRAFGADKVVFDVKDERLRESVDLVTGEWGGPFTVEYIDKWKPYVKSFDGDIIHLTMYGINVNEAIGKIRDSGKDKLVIVGGKKVPSDLYEMVDYNVAIGNQPHSEVAALGVFLDRLFEGSELDRKFKDGRKIIIPKEHGKEVSTR